MSVRRNFFAELISDMLSGVTGLKVITKAGQSSVLPNALFMLGGEQYTPYSHEGGLVGGAFNGVLKFDVLLTIKVQSGNNAESELSEWIDKIEQALETFSLYDLENDTYITQVNSMYFESVTPSISDGSATAQAWFEGVLYYNQYNK